MSVIKLGEAYIVPAHIAIIERLRSTYTETHDGHTVEAGHYSVEIRTPDGMPIQIASFSWAEEDDDTETQAADRADALIAAIVAEIQGEDPPKESF